MLKAPGVEPIIPCGGNNTQATDQGRRLEQYRHRWIIERTIEWLGTFRRLVVRYERLVTNYAGLFHMACALVTDCGAVVTGSPETQLQQIHKLTCEEV